MRTAARLVRPAVLAATTAALAAGLLAGPIAAGKPAAGSGTISLVLMDGAAQAEYGGRVTFAVATTATAYPYVHLTCTQGGTKVLEAWQGFFETAIGNQWFHLGPTPAWTGGAADCRAELQKATKRGGWSTLAATTFPVAP